MASITTGRRDQALALAKRHDGHDGQSDSQNILKQSSGQIASEQLRSESSGPGAGECSSHAADESSKDTNDEVSMRKSDGRSDERAHHHTGTELRGHKAAGSFG